MVNEISIEKLPDSLLYFAYYVLFLRNCTKPKVTFLLALLYLLLHHKDLKARINKGHSHRMLLSLPRGPIAFKKSFFGAFTLFLYLLLCGMHYYVSVSANR